MNIIGIDPGKTGSICVMAGEMEPVFHPAPSSLEDIGSCIFFLNSVFTTSSERHYVIEDVHSLFGMSAKSNFQFGKNLGFCEALVGAMWPQNYTYLAPKKWQEMVGIKFPKGSKPKDKKQITFERAISLYPTAKLRGPKGGLLDGRADALMIAHAKKLELLNA